MPSPSLRKDRPSRRLRAPLRHHPQGDKGHGREADRRLRLRALQGPATRPIRALLYLHPERENGAALRAYADSGLVLLSSRSRELRSTWSRLRQAYGPEGTNLSLNVPSMSPDTPMRTIARGTNLSPQCHPDVPWMSPRNPMRTRFCEICPLGRHDPISPKFRPNRHCQSASNRDPGSASKKDPPAGRVEGPQRRDRRRGAGQGERSGVDLVPSLPPLPVAACGGRLPQERVFSRQLALPVSRISQWCVSRSSNAVVIFASPNTLGHSANGRLVVTTTEVRS